MSDYMGESSGSFRPALSRDGSRVSLANRGLTSVPGWVGDLTSLRELDLTGNELTDLPEFLVGLATLTKLQLAANRLTSLPEWLADLTEVSELDLSANNLTSLPESIENLKGLTALYLSGNGLTDMPSWIGSLTDLTKLHVAGNRLTKLPESLSQLDRLIELSLGGNGLFSVPEWLGDLATLQRLYLSNCGLSSLPDSLTKLTITGLDLTGNRLTMLRESFGNLASLKLALLAGNALNKLPESIGNLTGLTGLDLSSNRLASLPNSIGNLAALTELNLNGNKLTELPQSLQNLVNLTELDISDNALTLVPDWVCRSSKLSKLDLSHNRLIAVPEQLGFAKSLSVLRLDGNPIRSPLLEIAEDGTAAVKAYLQLVSEEAAELWVSKLLVVGEGAVGKTSLVKVLSGQRYDPAEPTTHGIHITNIELNHPLQHHVRMRLSSWDFGGQDIYHATHQFFLSDRSLFVLLWNARQGWEQAKLHYWLDVIKARAPHARIILVATHTEGRPVDLPLSDLKGSYPQIVDSSYVDNRTGEGIEGLRRTMAMQAAKLPLMGSRWPKTWLSGVEAITHSGLQHATPEELYVRLAKTGVTDRSHQTYLLRALHLLGDILYFDEDEELRDTVILRPQWVDGYIAKVLDSPEVAGNQGLLTRAHGRALWADLHPGLRDRFLLMMEKFDLSYRTTNHATAASLVVERLPWESPAYQDRWAAALERGGAREIRLRYRLSTLPPGIPTWFIAREHRFTTGLHWRSGALFSYTWDPRVLGLIQADRQDKIVDLIVRGPVPQLFFSVLQDGFELTLSRYQGLEISRMVPCVCGLGDESQDGSACKHMYQYYPLLRRLEQGIQEVECELSFTRVRVAELLFGIAPGTTDEVVNRLDKIDRRLEDFAAETTWAHREFLKALRRSQARSEAVCPCIFTLTPATTGRIPRPGIRQLELRLYCEQPGGFHALREPPYVLDQPTRLLTTIRPYLNTLLMVLKHAAPLVSPVLGLTAHHLADQLAQETSLMTEVVSQLPEPIDAERIQAGDLRQPRLDVNYRALYAVLHTLDPSEHWAGLSRTYTPEGEVLWLCRDHAQQFNP